MARLSDRGLSAAEAQAWKERANGPHTVRWTADVFRWVDGEEHTLWESLPIVGGSLSMDGSDPNRRHLTMEVGSAGELVPDQPSDPLAPFGQKVRLWVTIDAADGSWLPRLRMGEFVIVTTSSEWPGLAQTIECADYSYLADTYLFERKRSFGHRTVRAAVEQIIEEAIPDQLFTVNSPNDAQTILVEPHTNIEAGTSRWEAIQSITEARGFDAFFSASGNLIIRHAVSSNDNEVETIPGEGPDIGTISNPVAVIRDGPGGNLVALTASGTREGSVNGVFINLHETVSQTMAARKLSEATSGVIEDDPDDTLEDGSPVTPDDTSADPELQPIPNPGAGDPRVNVTIAALGVGPVQWGDRFGRQNILLDRNVKRINNSNVNAEKKRAKRLLHRRAGVIKTIDLDAVGLYWVEPDDKIRLAYAGRSEDHFAASVEIDLAAEQPTRIRTRALTVTDLG